MGFATPYRNGVALCCQGWDDHREHDQLTAAALLAAGERAVAQGGLEALSVRGVAAEAATTTRAVYSLFGSRDGLIAALGAHTYDLLRTALERLPQTVRPASRHGRSRTHVSPLRARASRAVLDRDPTHAHKLRALATIPCRRQRRARRPQPAPRPPAGERPARRANRARRDNPVSRPMRRARSARATRSAPRRRRRTHLARRAHGAHRRPGHRTTTATLRANHPSQATDEARPVLTARPSDGRNNQASDSASLSAPLAAERRSRPGPWGTERPAHPCRVEPGGSGSFGLRRIRDRRGAPPHHPEAGSRPKSSTFPK